MSDRELLEKAARAAGYEIRWNEHHPWGGQYEIKVVPEPQEPYSKHLTWNPLHDDGDALRLAVKLKISLIHEQEYMGGRVFETIEATSPAAEDFSRHVSTEILNDRGTDEMTATRRAIVSAAAEIADHEAAK